MCSLFLIKAKSKLLEPFSDWLLVISDWSIFSTNLFYHLSLNIIPLSLKYSTSDEKLVSASIEVV